MTNSERWTTVRALTGALQGTYAGELHIADDGGGMVWPCGHLHTFERTARLCVAERWPDVPARTDGGDR